jgi:D-alanine transaminase
MSTGTAYFNGEFVPRDEVRISPDDRGFLFADGVYEVVRSYGGRLFCLDRHLARLTAGLAALRIDGVDSAALRGVCDELLRRNALGDGDALVYVQVTRGAAPRAHAFPTPPVRPTVYAAVTAFRPKGDPAHGLRVITVPDVRWARCDIKSVALLPNCLAQQRARDAGAQEAIFIRDGVAIEGASSNFFGVFEGVVHTAPASNYILPGVTRSVVLELCREHGLEACEGPVYESELSRAEELFLAGTTIEVMPVVSVDGRPVGSGRPGPVARRLLELFRARTLAPASG